MSKPLRIILISAAVLVLLAGAALIFGTMGMDEVKNAVIPDIHLEAIADGAYEGECTISRWAVRVKVSVKDNLISDINLVDKKMSNLGPDMLKQINQNLIGRQTPVFDAISGASITSKGYLIAVANALQKAAR